MVDDILYGVYDKPAEGLRCFRSAFTIPESMTAAAKKTLHFTISPPLFRSVQRLVLWNGPLAGQLVVGSACSRPEHLGSQGHCHQELELPFVGWITCVFLKPSLYFFDGGGALLSAEAGEGLVALVVRRRAMILARMRSPSS
jgi:hypothetical protein